MENTEKPNHILDVQGMLCPLPVIKAKKQLKALHVGETLLVLTTDPVAQIDIPHMCSQFGYTLVRMSDTATGHEFLVRK